jgi:hypothetical protein
MSRIKTDGLSYQQKVWKLLVAENRALCYADIMRAMDCTWYRARSAIRDLIAAGFAKAHGPTTHGRRYTAITTRGMPPDQRGMRATSLANLRKERPQKGYRHDLDEKYGKRRDPYVPKPRARTALEQVWGWGVGLTPTRATVETGAELGGESTPSVNAMDPAEV